VIWVDPATLRNGAAVTSTGPPTTVKRVEPDYFKKRAALLREREWRDAINAALRPGDKVLVPEHTAEPVWRVQSVDRESRTLQLTTTIFTRPRDWTVCFADAEMHYSDDDWT
jgi:hypothetical protein